MSSPRIAVPALVRIKPNAFDRVGLYLARAELREIAVLSSEGLVPELLARLGASLTAHDVSAIQRTSVASASFEDATTEFARLPPACRAIVGVGGGKALDVAKYVAFLANRPYCAVPTSLSNDGFCSPLSSLTINGKRRSLASKVPAGVIVDTTVCLDAPLPLWWSGVGDLVAKITAVQDWKRAFHATGELVNDLSALLSDATVRQFMSRPRRDDEGVRLLATSLMLNGIAMEISGTSRPASGSEHLISHALDGISTRPRLHGLQVGVATYLVSHLQGHGAEDVGRVLDETSFWDGIRNDPFDTQEWCEAVRQAPSIKPGFHTVLSERDCLPDIQRLIETDPRLAGCFT